MRALEKAQSSSNQTRLDDFFSLLDEVEVICLKNEKLTSLLKQSNSGFNYELYSPIVRQMLKRMLGAQNMDTGMLTS